MTEEQIQRHEESGEALHVPGIVHRSGGVPATLLNTCGICGAYIVPSAVNSELWLETTEADAGRIRNKWKAEKR
jgi:hypothetical protein